MFGIYIHIPFCVRRCPYCDFFSTELGNSNAPHEEYFKAIKNQLMSPVIPSDEPVSEVGLSSRSACRLSFRSACRLSFRSACRLSFRSAVVRNPVFIKTSGYRPKARRYDNRSDNLIFTSETPSSTGIHSNLDLSNRVVDTIYFGGGTPSLMPPVFFEQVISEISRHFKISDNVEISCEVNPAGIVIPESPVIPLSPVIPAKAGIQKFVIPANAGIHSNKDWFASVKKAGVNRISIGVQTFNPRLLKILGRIHTNEDAMRAIAEAQDSGFNSVSIDLMFAINGETISDLEEDVRTAMTFQPQHISAYQLTIDEEKVIEARGRRQEARLTSEEEIQLKQLRVVSRMLSRSGWTRYEISNYAKPGFECRHNVNCWRYGEYLGLGAGASSFVRSRDGEIARSLNKNTHDLTTSLSHDLTRFTQIRDVKKYMSGMEELAESETISPKTAMGEFCFLGLRMMEGISSEVFEQTFGVSFENIYGDVCKKLIDDGLVCRENERIKLTPKGIELSDYVFRNFIQ